MKTMFAVLLLLIPGSLFAANPGTMPQGNMQDMMQAMQKVQECMSQIDQQQMQELQMESEKLHKEIESLCAAGKRDKAQKQAMKFGKEMASKPVMQQLQKCGEMAQGAVPMMEGLGVYDEKKYEETHVCDQ